MSDVVRAWKDEAYRQTLSTEEQAVLPVNPVGEIELMQEELEAISGALDGYPGSGSNRVEERLITYQPVFAGSTISLLVGSSCDNISSPTSSIATGPSGT